MGTAYLDTADCSYRHGFDPAPAIKTTQLLRQCTDRRCPVQTLALLSREEWMTAVNGSTAEQMIGLFPSREILNSDLFSETLYAHGSCFKCIPFSRKCLGSTLVFTV